jgi:hypothetical protein
MDHPTVRTASDSLQDRRSLRRGITLGILGGLRRSLTGVQATNWRAEQAIRPAVVTRKSRGGNRTRAGADAWQVLTSVLRTATQQGRDPIELLTRLLQAPTPIVADLAIPGH